MASAASDGDFDSALPIFLDVVVTWLRRGCDCIQEKKEWLPAHGDMPS